MDELVKVILHRRGRTEGLELHSLRYTFRYWLYPYLASASDIGFIPRNYLRGRSVRNWKQIQWLYRWRGLKSEGD